MQRDYLLIGAVMGTLTLLAVALWVAWHVRLGS
jgi:hypothetical protein